VKHIRLIQKAWESIPCICRLRKAVGRGIYALTVRRVLAVLPPAILASSNTEMERQGKRKKKRKKKAKEGDDNR